MVKDTRILVLGATGFVGKNVAEVLKDSSFNVILHNGKKEIDLTQLSSLTDYLSQHQPHFIINCAAKVGSLHYVSRYAADVIDENLKIILNLYKAISQVNKSIKVIHPVANCAYPATTTTFKEDEWMNGPLHPSVMPYGATRRMIWHVGESYYAQHGIRSYYFFVPNMYGPYDSTNPDKAHALNALISKFVKAKFEKQSVIPVWGTGVAIREWLYAKDFAKVVSMFLQQPNKYSISEPINIAQNFGLSVRDLVDIINQHFQNHFQIQWDDSMPDGAPRKVMSDNLFRRYFPDFTFTDLHQGIKKTIEYYQSVYPY